jgi:hypothetical protein
LSEIWSRNAKFMNEYTGLAGYRVCRGPTRPEREFRAKVESVSFATRAPSSVPEMRMAGALFHMVNVARDVLVFVMMPDAVKSHFIVATRATHAIAVRDAANTLAERRTALGTADANFQVVDGIVHSLSPRKSVPWSD